MAPNSKPPIGYNLTATARRRNTVIQIGLTAVVVIFAVVLVLSIVTGRDPTPAPGEAKAVRVTSSKLITKDGGSEPKAVLSLYEDFLCPHCGQFERDFADTIARLIDTGAVAVDYYLVAILDSAGTQDYSSRAANAAYVVAEQSTDVFRRFHGALFAQQPGETAASYPDDEQLIALARQVGASGDVATGITNGKYTQMVQGLAAATAITGTPTVRINGQDYRQTTPAGLIAKIEEIVGDVPGLDAPASTPATP